jgi:hypothetical protein
MKPGLVLLQEPAHGDSQASMAIDTDPASLDEFTGPYCSHPRAFRLLRTFLIIGTRFHIQSFRALLKITAFCSCCSSVLL